MSWLIANEDCRSWLASQSTDSVNCIVTSPPYWGLRDYGVDGQIGHEETPEEYTAVLVDVFREARRVLRGDGTLWLNLGDSYANDGKWGGYSGGKHANGLHGPTGVGRAKRLTNLKPKDLVGIPWRVAFALQADGWWLRSDIIWAKPNPMPESVSDRPTKAHEYLFLLTKSERYFYEADAIREPHVDYHGGSAFRGQAAMKPRRRDDSDDRYFHPAGRNRRSVWNVALEPFRGAHFAVMPTALVEPCVRAGCPVGGTVMDPFAGAGTVGAVAVREGRHFSGCELNPEYAEIARSRVGEAAAQCLLPFSEAAP